MKTLSIPFAYTKPNTKEITQVITLSRAIKTCGMLLGISTVMYIIFMGFSVYFVGTRKAVEEDIKATMSRISELELTYYTTHAEITEDTALVYGFAKPSEELYAKNPSSVLGFAQ